MRLLSFARLAELTGSGMVKRISGAEYPIAKIFSSEFEFVIPSYQRPYAWQIDQVSELIDDLSKFKDAETDEGYFLGSIVLIKSEGVSRAEVIDGQQRLTTLTILLAAMACAHDATNAQDFKDYVLEPGKKMEGIEPKPRLSPRERDRDLFRVYVQGFRLPELVSRDPAGLDNEAQRNVRANAAFLLREIEARFATPEAVAAFARFLLNRCFLVAVTTPTQASAFRVFSVMNSRGLDLQATDIVKADVIGKIPNEAVRQAYSEKWEATEVELGREGFNDLFGHIRTIYVGEKAKQTLLEEFRVRVLPRHPDPMKLVDMVLDPFAAALADIRGASFAATTHAETVNGYLRWLNRFDNSDWVPPAMLFIRRYRDDTAQVARFLQLLERRAAFMYARRYNVNDRIASYAKIVKDIEAGREPDAIEELQFTDEARRNFHRELDGDIYLMTPRRRNYIILRLDAFVSDGGASHYDPSVLTIEHVLPQTVASGSQWAEWWPDTSERDRWVHRLANLLPLNKKRNSAAQNFDFARKCETYFSGTRGVTSYALTSQVLAQKDWTPATVATRQAQLVGAMLRGWELDTAR